MEGELSKNNDRSFGERIHSILDDGREIRANTADAVREALGIVDKADESLAAVADSVIEGAVGAAAAKMEEQGDDSTLRDVIEGLGDGLESTAQAVELTLAEARSSARSYAEEDLRKTAGDLKGVGELLLETAKRAAGQLENRAGKTATNLVEHARRTVDRVRPSLDAAADTALGDLAGLAKQAAGASAAAAREGVGTLLTELGSRLRKGGEADPTST
jgi:hypothetical protein